MEIDRRGEYYNKVGPSITADPLEFYCRAERGREIQRNIKPSDYDTPERVFRIENNLNHVDDNVIDFRVAGAYRGK